MDNPSPKPTPPDPSGDDLRFLECLSSSSESRDRAQSAKDFLSGGEGVGFGLGKKLGGKSAGRGAGRFDKAYC